ncbi:ribosome-associated protein [Arboricoccus pini]|uniref:Ribosome-associated protein n=1 Tax=Arboricoccus pini TaxID=1963835 RepID=A0A212R818_9PROT|nr:alternative ribosome rescue aminoacyl-tRNA hydrolase ArfB [Arboricoccus pini]SNB68173.1 ribosome-associated protein [Arboricoccus pini]
MAGISVSADLQLDEDDVDIVFVRASGPGGQNVNKVASAVQLRFHVGRSQALNAGAKERLAKLAGDRLTQSGVILIFAQRHRTQKQNRDDAISRLKDLVLQALEPPIVRRATRPTRASKERRIAGKTSRSRTKALRSTTNYD